MDWETSTAVAIGGYSYDTNMIAPSTITLTSDINYYPFVGYQLKGGYLKWAITMKLNCCPDLKVETLKLNYSKNKVYVVN